MPTPNPQTQGFNPTSRSDVKAEEYKLLKRSVQLRQGFEAMMLDKIQRQNEAVFDLTDRCRNGLLGKSDTGVSIAKDDNMGVNVGDVIHNTNIYGDLSSSTAAALAGMNGLNGGGPSSIGEANDPPIPPEPEPKVDIPIAVPTAPAPAPAPAPSPAPSPGSWERT